jgi:ABC-type phosphate/phosphonate transport system substrate-binding protein
MATAWRLGCLLTLAAALAATSAEEARPAKSVDLRLGMVSSLFRDRNKNLIQLYAEPLCNLLASQTSLTGQLTTTTDALTLGKQLQENQLELAVFHGFEFAWARQKYPQLQPLVLVSRARRLQAYLVVADASPVKTCDDLRGKTLALPLGSRAHGFLFLERRCAGGQEPQAFFGKITRPREAETALDAVAAGRAQAALVERADLQAYKAANPDDAAGLRVLLQSEVFPTGVIGYRAGALADDVVQRLRSGLLGANETRLGRELLELGNMTGFELAPEGFDQTLRAIAKAYPPPSGK